MDTPPAKPLDQPCTGLVERVRNELRLKHYAYRTEEAYVGRIRRFILFHGKKHPADMGAAEVAAAYRDECGRPTRTVQGLFGHADVKTTMIYKRILDASMSLQKGPFAVRSPLD